MAAQNKLTAPNKITTTVHTLLDGLHSMSKSETIIGDAYQLGEATIVPVHRIRIALGAGSVQGGAKQESSSGESGGLGAGGAVQIEPVAVIAVGRDGIPRIMCVETESDAADKLMKQLPDLVSSAAKILTERVAPMVTKLLNRNTATALGAAKDAVVQAVPALAAAPAPKEDP